MSRDSVAWRVSEMLAKQLGLLLPEVTPDATLESLGADDLDVVEIVIDLEDAFGIEIPDDEVEDGLTTVAEVIRYVDAALAAQRESADG
jgi:acyl carrier protein